MGTSGSYGGSGQPAWDRARQAFDDLAVGTDGGEVPPGGGEEPAAGGEPVPGGDADTSGAPPPDPPAAAVVVAVLDALGREDSEIRRPTPLIYPIATLLPRGGGGGGLGGSRGGGGGGGAFGSSAGGGRAGQGSPRRVGRGAQRGAAALAAGYALRQGDTATLAELGLDLADLQTKSPARQCVAILKAVIGDGNHPDDQALKLAAAAQLKAVLAEPTPPSVVDSIRNFIANFVIELSVVELQARHRAGVAAQNIRDAEHRMRRYVLARVRGINVAGPRLAIAEFQATAMRVLGDVRRVFGAAGR
jgi:hypothetical protein